MTCLNRWTAVLGLLASLYLAAPGRAEVLEVDIVDAVMTAGSSGYIDVILKGTGAPISGFEYTITITGAAPGLGNVVFATQVVDISNTSGYVFNGNSSHPSVQVSSLVNTEVIGNDVLDTGEMIVNGQYLLARLNVEHQGELAGSEAIFDVMVTQATFYHSVIDEELNEVLTPYDSGDIVLGSGKLKIIATPEPATLGALGLASIFAVRTLKQRSRKAVHG